MTAVFSIVQFVLTTLVPGAILYFANRQLAGYFATRPHLKIRHQLIQTAAIVVAILFLILLMPIDTGLRDQLLRLYGLVISATIALSSTTLVGNMMAGVMLRVIGNCKPGNYITVGDYFGRISEMDLFHTEIQTEERDLTTLPNLALAFDKAEKAESVEKLREILSDTEARIKACDEIIAKPPSEQAAEAAQAEKTELVSRIERLNSLIARKEEKISKA